MVRIGIELVDEVEELGFGGVCRQVEGPGHEAHLFAGLALVAHVDLRGRDPLPTSTTASPGARLAGGHLAAHVLAHDPLRRLYRL